MVGDDEEDPPVEGAGDESQEPAAPWPESDPADHEEGKSFAVRAESLRDALLAVTIRGGEVAAAYAPARVAIGLADRVQALLREIGGGLQPMFFGALGEASMTLYFGDPRAETPQGQLPIEATLDHARRVAELIDLEGDELFAQAVRVGRPAEHYRELVHFILNEGVTVSWTPRGDRPRELTPDRAAVQHKRLIAEPEMSERTLTVNGKLYRVIATPAEERLGTVGIRLHDWSARPPARGAKYQQTILVAYRTREVEDAIRDGLFGQPVAARILIRQPLPGASLDAEDVSLELVEISAGPSEESRKGPRLMEDDEL